MYIKNDNYKQKHHLPLWGLRVFWGPGEVLTCPDICVVFSVSLENILNWTTILCEQHESSCLCLCVVSEKQNEKK